MDKNLLTLLRFVNKKLAAQNGMTADEVRTLAVLVHNITSGLPRVAANTESP